MADNPFGSTYRAILDPNQPGTIMGAIGGLMGAPTRSEAVGSVTGNALKELSQLKQSGKSNAEALMTWFQTPRGQEFFTTAGPDGMKSLAEGLTQMTPPAPQLHNVAEGGQLWSTSPGGQPKMIANNPKSRPNATLGPQDQMYDASGKLIAQNANQKMGEVPAEVRTFQYFQSIANLPAAEMKRLAALKLDPTMADKSTASTQAVDELVKNYGLDPRMGEALKAGVIKVLPLKNDLGQDTGAVSIIDLSNPAQPSVQMITPGQRRYPAPTGAETAPALPGAAPNTGAPAGVLPQAAPQKRSDATGDADIPAQAAPVTGPGERISEANPKYFGDKASMFLASGVMASTLRGASSVSEQLAPNAIIPEGAKSEDRKTLINILRSNLAAMGQLGGGIGVNKGVLEGYLKLAPTGDASESPHQAVQKAIRLYEHIDTEITAEEEKFRNVNLPNDERKQSQIRAEGWRRVQRSMPTYEELGRIEKAIREGTAGAPTIAGTAKTVIDAASKSITGVKKEAKDINDATKTSVDIDKINDPKELLAIDPRTLDRSQLLKYIRKIEAIKKGKRSDIGGNTQMAEATVQQLHPPGTFSRNTQGGDVINGVARTLGIGPPNNVIQYPKRSS